MRCARLPRHHTYTHYTIFPYSIHTITGDTRLPHRPSAWEQQNLCPCHACKAPPNSCQAHPNSCQAHPNACQTHPNPSAPLPSWSSAWKEGPVCSCQAHPNSCQAHPNACQTHPNPCQACYAYEHEHVPHGRQHFRIVCQWQKNMLGHRLDDHLPLPGHDSGRRRHRHRRQKLRSRQRPQPRRFHRCFQRCRHDCP